MNIPSEIIFDHLIFFRQSLLLYYSEYAAVLFKMDAEIPPHLVYICPLCAKNYFIVIGNNLEFNVEFSLDHYPPQSIGGKSKILTCKKCNNNAGTVFEGELKKKMNFEASKYGDGIFPAKFKNVDFPKNLNSYLTKDEQGKILLDFSIEAKEKNPILKNWLENTAQNSNWEITLTIDRPDDKKVLRSILKAAYLLCFANWGYDFIYSTNGALLRDALNNSIEYPVQLLWFDRANLPKHTKLPAGLCEISSPINLKSFIVNIPLKLRGYLSTASILIPYAGISGWDKLKEINTFLSQHESNELAISFNLVKPSLPLIIDGYSSTSPN